MSDAPKTGSTSNATASVPSSVTSTGARDRSLTLKDQRQLMTQALNMLASSGEGNPFTRLWNPQTDNDRRIAKAYNNESAARYMAWEDQYYMGDKTGSFTLRARNKARKFLRENPEIARRYKYSK